MRLIKAILLIIPALLLAAQVLASSALTSDEMGRHKWMSCNVCHFSEAPSKDDLKFVNGTATTNVPALCGQCHSTQYEKWTKNEHYISSETKCTQKWCHYFNADQHDPSIPEAAAPVEAPRELVGFSLMGVYISYPELFTIIIVGILVILAAASLGYYRRR